MTFGDETLSYAQFQHRIDCLADQLVAGGVGSGDRVAYLGPNHSAFLISLFACARSGATFVPLNFRLTGPELAYILDDCGATTLIADATLTSVVDEVRSDLSIARYVAVGEASGWESFDDLLAVGTPIAEPVFADPADVAVIMYTSGTTGRPKLSLIHI